MTLPAGKLPLDLLRALLETLPSADSSVIVGSAVGEDAAVIDAGGPELLVAKTDPITLAGEDPGAYLLAVNANDLAAMGAEPRWLLVTALLPEGVEPGGVARLFESLRRACESMNVSLVGGHTEITAGLSRPILVGCLLGTAPRGRLVRTSGAQPGDAILLAGGIAIEGTAILAGEHAEALLAAGVDREVIARAAEWLDRPGLSVLPAARAANAAGAVHAMHDPTEGGLLTALCELAEAAGVGFRVERSAIPVLPECAVICGAVGLDPLGLLASGALLITLDPAEVPAALVRLREAGIQAAWIGEILPPGAGRAMVNGGRAEAARPFARDELARYLASLREAGPDQPQP